MAKKPKFEPSGDADDLQSLFDSMAGATSDRPRLEVIDAKVADGSEPHDLQALFDSVAESFDDTAVGSESPAVETGAMQGDALYRKLGQLTRQVHESLRELGHDSSLEQAAEAIPDACERLNHIAQTTEQAVSRVLNATDIAMPIQDRVGGRADTLRAQWDRVLANELSVDEFTQLGSQTRDYLGAVADDSRATHAQLTEIMIAQDFQGLTGQVFKKVVALAQALETQLLEVLIETAPEGKKPRRKDDSLLNGPMINGEGRKDVVISPAQVDALLERLGF